MYEYKIEIISNENSKNKQNNIQLNITKWHSYYKKS